MEAILNCNVGRRPIQPNCRGSLDTARPGPVAAPAHRVATRRLRRLYSPLPSHDKRPSTRLRVFLTTRVEAASGPDHPEPGTQHALLFSITTSWNSLFRASRARRRPERRRLQPSSETSLCCLATPVGIVGTVRSHGALPGPRHNGIARSMKYRSAGKRARRAEISGRSIR